jgi:two-component system, OmpR family, sensor histidine kinase TctE
MQLPLSLKQRLLAWLLLPLIPLILLHAGWTYERAVQVANQAYDRSLYLAARTLAEEVQWHQGEFHLNLLRGAGYLFENHTGSRLFYRVDDLQGRLLAGNSALPQMALQPQASVHFFSLVQFGNGVYRGDPVRLVQLIHIPDAPPTSELALRITVAETLETRNELAAQVLRETLLGQSLLLLAALLLVLHGVQRGMKPLDSYRRQLAKRRDDDLSTIDVPHAPAELKPLIETLNSYLTRLGHLIQIRKRFLDNAAHQLRTPLTVLKTQLTLVGRALSDAERVSVLEAANRTSDHAIELTEQLLTLSQAEHAHEMQAAARVELVALAKQVTQEWLHNAHWHGADLGFEALTEQCEVLGHAALLQEVISNLIDNALSHGPSSVRVTVRVGAGWLEVEDNGPGIPLADQTHVFERFYRVPGSTARGSGLGLAIVREIALQHEAQLDLVSPCSEQRGTRVRLSWPAWIEP